MLYFAYGSNMYTKRLKSRVPSATKVAKIKLPDYKLCFHKRSIDKSGKCNIKKSKNSEVHGIIFQIDPQEKTKLDKVEGLGSGYEEAHLNISTDEKSFDVFTYLATESHIEDSLKPYSWYKTLVIEGAKEHNLPQGYIDMIQGVKSTKDPDKKRAQKELEIIK